MLKGIELSVYSSDFDFTLHETPAAVKLFKLHGSIHKDISDGHMSRLIITDTDYDHTEDYRRQLFDRFKSDLAGSHLIIVGHSLADPDIKEIVSRAISINAETMGGRRITLLLYTRDEDRALLYKNRGLEICFGGIDDYFRELAASKSAAISLSSLDKTERLIDHNLVAVTIDVGHAITSERGDATAMFNGWPAQYADVAGGVTFQRTLTTEVEEYLNTDGAVAAVILGASGVGKTTAARQVMVNLFRRGWACWEHKTDCGLPTEHWAKTMRRLKAGGSFGVLLVDEAHSHIHELNNLLEIAAREGNYNLKILVVSTRNHWSPRIKSANLFRHGKDWILSRLSTDEIERLLNLIDTNEKVKKLVEPMFAGFSRTERRRRLVDRCEKDFFVCLKNIFGSENLDDIILREYASSTETSQEIFKLVAALENAGVRVHRQLVIRLLHIRADLVSKVLEQLTDIINEYDVDEKEGIYGWRTRHPVISAIVTKYKFSDIDKVIALFDRLIDAVRPTFEIEIRTIRDLCNIETGLPRIPDKQQQNRLLRRLMSVAPGERVPRHRLIRNLIEDGEFEKAETEIRIFNNDFGQDGPVHRYKVNLMVARATRTPGILEEDRIAILEQAHELAVVGAEKYPNRHMLAAYADLGLIYYKKTGKLEYYDDALDRMKRVEEFNGDSEIGRTISRYERRLAGRIYEPLSDLDGE